MPVPLLVPELTTFTWRELTALTLVLGQTSKSLFSLAAPQESRAVTGPQAKPLPQPSTC